MSQLKKLILFLILLNISAAPAQAASRIVLLTSLNEWNSGPFWFRSKNREITFELEKIFRESEATALGVPQVVHNATQFDLWQALNDDEVKTVIWISHATKNEIVDRAGFDVSPLFLKAKDPAFKKFVAVIACGSEHVLQKHYKGSSNYEHLILFGEVNDVKPKEALKNTLYILQTNYKPLANTTTNHHDIQTCEPSCLKVTRRVPHGTIAYPVVRIEDKRGQVLAIFPSASPGETQSLEINATGFDLRELLVTSGRPVFGATGADFDLGQFSFLRQDDVKQKWEVFTDPATGKPWGYWRNIYSTKAK